MERAEQVLDIMKEQVNCRVCKFQYNDHALYHLLNAYRKELPYLDLNDAERFHKMFRQSDVTDNADIDMAIWNLLNASSLFWEIVNAMKASKNPDAFDYDTFLFN